MDARNSKASMGPRSRDRGIGLRFTAAEGVLRRQWGRGHVTAESASFFGGVLPKKWLQWGRGHVTAESRHIHEPQTKIRELQWGRGHVTAESGSVSRFRTRGTLASMGPRSRDRGIKYLR